MRKTARRTGIALVAGAFLVVGACSNGGSEDSASEPATVGDAVSGAADAASPQVAAGGEASVQVAVRHRIRTATADLVVDEPGQVAEVADRVGDRAGSLGGTVDDDRRRSGDSASAELVVRVPPDALDDFVAGLGELAEVTSSAITTDDVTDEYTDLEGRIENLRASVERIRALMAEADDVAQVAALEGELSRREQELESAEGRMRVLDEQVQLATATISISARDVAVEDEDDSGPPSPMDALAGGWDAFVAVLAWLLAVVLATLPFLVTAAVVVVVARVLLRRRPPRSGPGTGPGSRGGVGPWSPPPAERPAPPVGAWSVPGAGTPPAEGDPTEAG